MSETIKKGSFGMLGKKHSKIAKEKIGKAQERKKLLAEKNQNNVKHVEHLEQFVLTTITKLANLGVGFVKDVIQF